MGSAVASSGQGRKNSVRAREIEKSDERQVVLQGAVVERLEGKKKAGKKGRKCKQAESHRVRDSRCGIYMIISGLSSY